MVYLDRNHDDTSEKLNKGNGISPTVEKATTLYYDSIA